MITTASVPPPVVSRTPLSCPFPQFSSLTQSAARAGQKHSVAPINLAAFADGIVDDFGPRAAEAGVDFFVAVEPALSAVTDLLGDSAGLRQCIGYLVENVRGNAHCFSISRLCVCVVSLKEFSRLSAGD